MIPLAKNITRYFSLKEIAVVALAIVIAVGAGAAIFLNIKNEVTLNDNGSVTVVKTMKTTVKEVLDQYGITVNKEDFVNLPLETKLQKIKNSEIVVKSAVPIAITVDGKTDNIMTYRDNVKEALQNSQIELSDLDKLEGATFSDKIVSGMNIKVVRVREVEEKELLPIQYNVVTRENQRMDKDTQRVAREGKEGTNEKLFKVIYEDGKEVLRQFVKEAILSNPIDKVIEIGTVLNYKTTRGEVLRYKNILEMKSTAYTSSFADTGKNPGDYGFGITATGIKAYKGVIAVDPRVIPLGTRVYVEVAGSIPDYGYAIAADTGGAIKGNIIDLYFDDTATAINYGVQKCKVYVLVDN